jgi:hypothetical protein
VARALLLLIVVKSSNQETEGMAKQAITVNGEETLVREDTAKSYRGVYWALLSVLAFAIIAAILFFGGFLKSASDNGIQSPAEIERQAGR